MTSAAEIIDSLTYLRKEPEAVAKLRTPDGIDLVVYNPNTSSLISFHTASQAHGGGFESHQLNAGLRFEQDHLMGQLGENNIAAIARHMENSIPATSEDMRKKAFGQVRPMARAPKSKNDFVERKLDAAYRNGWLKKRISPVSWMLLNLLIVHDLSMKQLSQKLGLDQRYLGLRVREALSELANLYDLFDQTGGKDPDHPSYDASKR